MLNAMMIASRALAAPIAGALHQTHARMNSWVSRAETMPEQQKGGGFPTWAIVLIVGVVLVLCVLPFCVIGILTLLGPAIGNVFSNIIENMETP